MMRERPIISVPCLTQTLKSLEPGDYVHVGQHWAYGTIRQTASTLKISICTKQTKKGITIMRAPEIPEPK
jgi:hypothetical protein